MIWKKRNSDVARGDPRAVHTLNLDNLKDDEKREFYSAVSEHSQMDLYAGHVEHGHALDTVSTSASCPRCQAPTQQHYANFIYATQTAPRVMFAPAGYFCTACPTVIIDEEIIRQGISTQFTYQGVLGLDHEGAQHPDILKTWNGEKTVYIFDENANPMGLTTTARLQSARGAKHKRSSDRRKQMAKTSRKQNRRKR